MYDMSEGQVFLLLHCLLFVFVFFLNGYVVIPVPQVVKTILSPFNYIGTFSKINWSCDCVSISGFYIIFYWFMSILTHTTLSWLLCFKVNLEIGSIRPPTFLFLKIHLATLQPLNFLIYFRSILLISINVYWDFDWNCIYTSQFGEN